MARKSVRGQVKAGFRRTGYVLLMMGWFVLVLAGITEAVSPASDFSRGAPHRILGWVLLALAAVIFFWTMDRWARVFPALTGVATLNALIMLSSGHLLNEPSVPVPQGEALLGVVVMVAATLCTVRFTKGKPRLLDRLALFAFVFCVLWQAVEKGVTNLAMVIALASVLIAWVVSAIQRHREQSQSRTAAANPARLA